MKYEISVSVSQRFYAGQAIWDTEYLALCGCNWIVDMWGRVRRVTVCDECCRRGYPSEDQLTLLSVDDG